MNLVLSSIFFAVAGQERSQQENGGIFFQKVLIFQTESLTEIETFNVDQALRLLSAFGGGEYEQF